MAKSISGKKSNFKHVQNEFVNLSVTFIKDWTHKELKKFRTQPVVIPVGDYGFFIGPYNVQGISPDCWEVKQFDDTKIGDFINKKAAIIFCVYSTLKKYNKANEILNLDLTLGRIDKNLQYYEKTLKNAKIKRNDLKYSIWLNRYIDAKMQRRTYENILKKTINSAKYMNFGKEPL